MGSATSEATASSAKSMEKPCVLLRGASQERHPLLCPHSPGGESAQDVKAGKRSLGRPGASPDRPTPAVDGKAPASGGRLPFCLVGSLSTLSLHLAFVCASGYHTGHPGRVPPTGVPRWVQVPEGVIYATITLGIACPQSWEASGPCLLPDSETECMRPRGRCAPCPAVSRMPCVLLPQTLPVTSSAWLEDSAKLGRSALCSEDRLQEQGGQQKMGMELSGDPAFHSCSSGAPEAKFLF